MGVADGVAPATWSLLLPQHPQQQNPLPPSGQQQQPYVPLDYNRVAVDVSDPQQVRRLARTGRAALARVCMRACVSVHKCAHMHACVFVRAQLEGMLAHIGLPLFSRHCTHQRKRPDLHTNLPAVARRQRCRSQPRRLHMAWLPPFP